MLDFVRLHPNWAALIVFVLAFGESLAFVSLVLPFWAMLVGIGTIIGAADPLIFWSIVSAAAIGAAFGDWLSYWLGYHYHEQIQAMWPLKDHPKLLENGPQVLQTMGRLGDRDRPLLRARCAPACRSSPASREMPWLRFQIANWGSAFLWAFVLLSPGTFAVQWWKEYFY